MLIHSLLFFLFLNSAVAFLHIGYGRILWSTSDLVLTQHNILARLDYYSGNPKWRAVTSSTPVQALLVDEEIIVKTSDEIITGYNRANGSVLWTAKSDEQEIPGVKETARWNGEEETEWNVEGGVLKSEKDGIVRFEHTTGGWEREEGLTYPSEVIIVEEKGIVIVLSQLKVLYGVHLISGDIKWRIGLQGQRCGMRRVGDSVGVVCVSEGRSFVWKVEIYEGKIVQEEALDGFEGVMVAGGDCLRIIDEPGLEKGFDCGEDSKRWIRYDAASVWMIGEGRVEWKIDGGGGTVKAVIAGVNGHGPEVVRVTRERKVHYGYVDEDLLLVFVEDEAGTVAMLVDASSGSVVKRVRHDGVQIETGVAGKGWFVYSGWNRKMGVQEIFIMDMYAEQDGKVKKAVKERVSELTGGWILTEETGDVCAVQLEEESDVCRVAPKEGSSPKKILLVKSSVLANRRIVAMGTTKSELGITERSVIAVLESGQVAMVSKIWLDARRPKRTKEVDSMDFLWPYVPVINFSGASSRESIYIGGGKRVYGGKIVATEAVRGMESATWVAVAGVDLLVEKVHPGGKFDSLPDDFVHMAVVAMVGILSWGVWYTRQRKTKVLLSRAW